MVDARYIYGKEVVSFETLYFLEVHGHHYEFEEVVADKLVNGLTALNARKAKAEGITATVSKITAYDDDNDELITAYNLSDIRVTLKRSKPTTTQLF